MEETNASSIVIIIIVITSDACSAQATADCIESKKRSKRSRLIMRKERLKGRWELRGRKREEGVVELDKE